MIRVDDLNGANGFKIEGGEGFGLTLSSAGDLNDDGLPDLAITNVVLSTGDLDFVGGVYVLYGADDVSATIDAASIPSGSGALLTGRRDFELLGTSVAGGGDLNDDGVADLLAGGQGSFIGPPGRAVALFGDDALPLRLTTGDLSGATGFEVFPSGVNALLGQSVAFLGDIDGDGVDDAFLGEPKALPAAPTPSADLGWIVWGAPDVGDLPPLNAAGDRVAKVSVTFSGSLVSSVDGAGDFNGDGVDDIVIGLPTSGRVTDPETERTESRGEAIVLFGGARPASITLDGPPAPGEGLRIVGARADGEAGRVARAAGDVNGDGFGDLIVTAPRADGDAGAAFLLFGGSDLPAEIDLGALGAGEGMRIGGAGDGARLGQAAAALGDVNGDGFDDVILGAPGVGEAHVIFGAAALPDTLDLGLAPESRALRLTGNVANPDNGFGSAVAGPGDLNGDGLADIAVSGSFEAAAFVFYGEATLAGDPEVIVDTLEDVVDPDDGVTSLREAVEIANARGAEELTIIRLGAGVHALSRRGEAPADTDADDLDILGDVTLIGAGREDTVIDSSAWGGGDPTIFDVAEGAAFRAENLALVGGGPAAPIDDLLGEADESARLGANGGLVRNAGTTHLVGVDLRDASNLSPSFISLEGTPLEERITNSLFSKGGLDDFIAFADYDAGAAIYNRAGVLRLDDVHVSGVKATTGAGLFVTGGDVDVVASRFERTEGFTSAVTRDAEFYENPKGVGAIRVFEDVSSKEFNGAVIESSGGTVSISDTEFLDNALAPRRPDASVILVGGDGSIVLEDGVVFENNEHPLDFAEGDPAPARTAAAFAAPPGAEASAAPLAAVSSLAAPVAVAASSGAPGERIGALTVAADLDVATDLAPEALLADAPTGGGATLTYALSGGATLQFSGDGLAVDIDGLTAFFVDLIDANPDATEIPYALEDVASFLSGTVTSATLTGPDGEFLLSVDDLNHTLAELYLRTAQDRPAGEILFDVFGTMLTVQGRPEGSVFHGTARDETFLGETGDDTYRVAPGGGHDTLSDAGGRDALDLSGFDRADVLASRDPDAADDLLLGFADGGSLRIRDGLTETGRIESIVFDDGEGLAPLVQDDTAEARAGALVEIDVLANDVDPEGDILAVETVSPGTSLGATVMLRDDGRIALDYADVVIDPDLIDGQTAFDTFTYSATDGALSSDPATVTVTVSTADDAALAERAPVAGVRRQTVDLAEDGFLFSIDPIATDRTRNLVTVENFGPDDIVSFARDDIAYARSFRGDLLLRLENRDSLLFDGVETVDALFHDPTALV